MVTTVAILLVVLALLSIIGGLSMMMEKDSGFLTRYMGYNAINSGFQILVKIIPELLEAFRE